MNIAIRANDKQHSKKNIDYNVSVLQLLQQLRLHSTDVAALYTIRSYEKLIDAIATILVPEGGQDIESVSVAAELSWRRLLIDLASDQQVDPPELISRALHSIHVDLPGLSEGMVGLLHKFLSLSILPFVSLYFSVLRYRVPAQQIITDAPLPVSITTLPPLTAFQPYEQVLAEHEQRVLQQASQEQERSLCPQPSQMISPYEVECMASEDDRSLLLRTKRAPSEAVLRAQGELTGMGVEDTMSAALSASINEEHRARKEEQDYTNLISQKLQAPTDTLLESLRMHRQQLSDLESKPHSKVNK